MKKRYFHTPMKVSFVYKPEAERYGQLIIRLTALKYVKRGSFFNYGAREGTRTPIRRCGLDPKSSASANSATLAYIIQ
jgi:hypothetical protein